MHALIRRVSKFGLESKPVADERGSFLIYFSILLISLLTMGSFAVDLGFGFSEMRRAQIATDHAALAAMYELVERAGDPNNDTKKNAIINLASAVAQANGVGATELSNGTGTGITLGIWDFSATTFTATNDISLVNSIRIGARRNVPTMLAVIYGFDTLYPKVSSIAAVGSPTSDICMVPYAITDELIAGAQIGDIITVDRGTTSPGNWGKVNVDPQGNMSSRNEFIPAFLSGLCNVSVGISQQLPSAPGFAGVESGFEQRLAQNPVMKILVIDTFYNGKKFVDVMGFATVEIVRTSGKGRNWTAELRFLSNASGSGTGGPGGGVFNRSVSLVQ